MTLVDVVRTAAEMKQQDQVGKVLSADTSPDLIKDERKDACTITLKSKTVRTLEGALVEANVDTAVWDVERWLCNKWDCAAKGLVGDASGFGGSNAVLGTTELWQVKVWLRRKSPEVRSVEMLLDQLKEDSPRVPNIKRKKLKASERRALEISIFDAHFGLQCFKPSSDQFWSLDECEDMMWWAVEACLAAAAPYMPIEEIVFVFGNDFLHADNLEGKTTKGTLQPEAVTAEHVLLRAEKLAIGIIECLKEVAPVRVPVVPGNHAYLSEMFMGRILLNRFWNDDNVTVDASTNPYKFFHYGTNLIGYEHGHSIAPIRMAALMANECRDVWGQTAFRAWHVGDQHRRGSSKPVTFEEQSVSVEYLPGLTPPNAWHHRRSFNYQKRAATAFVYDFDCGQIAHIQRNISSYTGLPLS